MTTHKRFDASMRAWFEETSPTRLPGRVLDATFERTRGSRQDRGWPTLRGRLRLQRPMWALGGAGVVMMLAAVAFGSLLTAGPGKPAGIFTEVGPGWIAFGDSRGIWAMDPTRPSDPGEWVQLSSEVGMPKAWSPEGSKLLVVREVAGGWALFILHEDGREVRLADASYRSGGDFTPDGAKVVYASASSGGLAVIDAAGGKPELLGPNGYTAAISPDGAQIAYFEGSGDWGHSLRVINMDGTGGRVVLEDSITTGAGHVDGLDWSPDGELLLFAIDTQGIFVVGTDGSGLRKVASAAAFDGARPYWSPDGTLISYDGPDPLLGAPGALVIVRPDGTLVRDFKYGASGPWKPR